MGNFFSNEKKEGTGVGKSFGYEAVKEGSTALVEASNMGSVAIIYGSTVGSIATAYSSHRISSGIENAGRYHLYEAVKLIFNNRLFQVFLAGASVYWILQSVVLLAGFLMHTYSAYCTIAPYINGYIVVLLIIIGIGLTILLKRRLDYEARKRKCYKPKIRSIRIKRE
jgi:hypothetical protein